MTTCNYSCGTEGHILGRRAFFSSCARFGAGATLAGMGLFATPSVAAELAKSQKRMIVIRMAGGLSQLESWDPKPGAATGGPFRAIPTSVPGLQISELLPHTAKVMHLLALARGINTSMDDHEKGHYLMMTGRRKTPAQIYPEIGAVVAKALETPENSLPGHIVITPGGGGGRNADSAYLGPKYASIVLGNGSPPQHTTRPANMTDAVECAQEAFRRKLNDRFAARRKTAETEAWAQSFEQAGELMKQKEIFDLSLEPEKERERYGATDFGRHCLLARRLVEKGISFVQVTHSNYDTHNENFTFHFEQLGEFDRPFATLVQDLEDRGLLKHTLVVVLSEFGRTPNINRLYGRDHWGKAWSICLGGAGIKRGFVHGATNKDGTEVTEGLADGGHIFHTYMRALGVKSTGHFLVNGQKMPIADPSTSPILDLLA